MAGNHPADFTGDGHVDQADLTIFDDCATGPDVHYDPQALPPGCTLTPDAQNIIAADFDRDQDVDQADYGIFQRCISGTGSPDSACTQ